MVTEFLPMALFHPGIHPTVKNYCRHGHPINLWSSALYLNIVFIFVYLIKVKIRTYTSYNEHYNLYSKIHGSIAVHSCQVGLAQKDIILLSKSSLIVYKAGKQTGVTNTEFIKFTLSGGIYSIDDFNAKIKVSILQQRQGW